MSWVPVAPEAVAQQLATRLAEQPGLVRVAVDGPPCAEPEALADALLEPLRALGRPAVHIRSSSFWRDASLRLEHGREDVASYASWVDAAALQREVLDAAESMRTYLPSLRDPETNRSTRVAPEPVRTGQVIIVSGPLLLGLGLPFDRTVHLATSPATRARRTSSDDAWTLPAFDDYEAAVRPTDVADVVVKVDDPRHPAVRWH
ncbi:MAG TPA: hypothetical protein VKB75_06135 [Jatrophihabitans sp.]|nr:hypothetical protein [Jatrophihabitans sp.]